MNIVIDDLTGSEIAALLQEHLQEMYAASPAESVHALDLDELRQPDITFWSIWQGDKLAGCVALKELDKGHAEIKSMRTASAFRRKGVAAQLLSHLIAEAKQRNYQRLSLETGPTENFAAARKLYERFGFGYCPPFADYREDPYSVFMDKLL
ncbi:MAG TPA: GNAT family N-acetyltransferase [Cellvibrio sp.]|nr:GNAT family N-acetyltransferase [Cellvibrio sp.]